MICGITRTRDMTPPPLQLYLELIAVRTQLIAKTKEIPRDMVEAVSSIIYAAQVCGPSRICIVTLGHMLGNHAGMPTEQHRRQRACLSAYAGPWRPGSLQPEPST